ncbi:MAG TPA: ornithine cyclodeaminase family protein [Burkholderiales bacterium]|nr:ornithine cyclodeaminase family protein [Burkholderiales bacterium]
MTERIVRYLTQGETQALLEWPEVISCIAEAYARAQDPRAAPPKVVARSGGTWLRALTAISGSGSSMGAKLIAKGKPRGTEHLIALWDQASGALACLMSGKGVTGVRTAATSAVAIDLIAPKTPLRVAVLGSGHEASTHVSALAVVRSISALSVYSPTRENRERFARRFGDRLAIPCRASKSAKEAVAGAGLVIAAARSHDETPILEGAWLEPGMMVVSIGSTVPEQREVDPEVIRRADRIVADVPDEVADETGDMIAARDAGIEFHGKIVALTELVQRRVDVQQTAGNIVLFKSVGSGLQDIAVSELCRAAAEKAGVGTLLPLDI